MWPLTRTCAVMYYVLVGGPNVHKVRVKSRVTVRTRARARVSG